VWATLSLYGLFYYLRTFYTTHTFATHYAARSAACHATALCASLRARTRAHWIHHTYAYAIHTWTRCALHTRWLCQACPACVHTTPPPPPPRFRCRTFTVGSGVVEPRTAIPTLVLLPDRQTPRRRLATSTHLRLRRTVTAHPLHGRHLTPTPPPPATPLFSLIPHYTGISRAPPACLYTFWPGIAGG